MLSWGLLVGARERSRSTLSMKCETNEDPLDENKQSLFTQSWRRQGVGPQPLALVSWQRKRRRPSSGKASKQESGTSAGALTGDCDTRKLWENQPEVGHPVQWVRVHIGLDGSQVGSGTKLENLLSY